MEETLQTTEKAPEVPCVYVPAFNIPALQAKVDGINRRARKLGLPQITLRETGNTKQKSYTCRVTEQSIKYTAIEVELLGLEVKLPGWELVACLTRTGDANLVMTVPGKTAPDGYITSAPTCDHCKKARVRKETFVLREEATDRFVQVGRDCIKDFLGHGKPESILWYADAIRDLQGGSEDGFSSIRGHESWGLDTVLELAAWCVGKFGWCSRKMAQEHEGLTPTRDYVSGLLVPVTTEAEKKDRREFLASVGQTEGLYPKITEANKANAAEAIEWANSLTQEEISGNNYLANLHTVAAFGFVDAKSMGLAVSILAARDNAKERARVRGEQEIKRAEQREKDLTSGYVGEVGKRGDFELTLERAVDLGPSQYSEHRQMLRFRDAAGNILVWFTGVCPRVREIHGEGADSWTTSRDLEVGETLRVRATVKKHDEYKGIRQTVLTRATIGPQPKAGKKCELPANTA